MIFYRFTLKDFLVKVQTPSFYLINVNADFSCLLFILCCLSLFHGLLFQHTSLSLPANLCPQWKRKTKPIFSIPQPPPPPGKEAPQRWRMVTMPMQGRHLLWDKLTNNICLYMARDVMILWFWCGQIHYKGHWKGWTHFFPMAWVMDLPPSKSLKQEHW